MKIEILAVDRLRSAWAREAVEEYLRRIGRYCPVERKDVKRAGEDAEAVAAEGERLLKVAAPGPAVRLVALDPTGDALDSAGWAALVGGSADEGVGRLVFVVGGAAGLAEDVRLAAWRTVGLGPQTLSHELAQVVLLEQLYRAWTILRGEPYHK
ncbi:MAG TPA: 23S rRNA (pseudouridine(1915)-N(3))-methyltransferase RlmH [Gemmatimonadota bacterium]|nr:23S rRNA (pseudouridine(1915)-N(3))-methyltransferase RlmH [Gemmatimonadota bacterium]